MEKSNKKICYWKKVETMTIIARETELKMIKAKIIYAERYDKISSLIKYTSETQRQKILEKTLPWLLHKKKRLDKLVKLSDKAKARYARALNRVA